MSYSVPLDYSIAPTATIGSSTRGLDELNFDKEEKIELDVELESFCEDLLPMFN